MADGISLNAHLSMVGARFAGLQDGWDDIVPGTCDEPPEHSLWDP
jgi:hypothetical protein